MLKNPSNPREIITMSNTWILVAHRAGARIFENTGPGQGLRLIENIPNPDGKLKNGEINSDKPGRAFDKLGGGRHSMSKEHEPKEQVAIQFAKRLGETLDKGRTHNQFGKLVLVAEPRFLGELRAALPSHTASMVSATVDKDLGGVNDREVAGHLGDAVRL
jgi:protein required for attachment to host cells